ncbi:hypothetical protein NHX12_010868 [Muraenolepis orangiensis]|uniref:Nucleoside diphosphate kinase B n=1 Tax=Muraenolepis orangiensis TaxID=630683 RepID=A0A9Q0DHU4_9TELE|nr:hypothetical protein NHX12_010868 [Muraenolepis orangiensis]
MDASGSPGCSLINVEKTLGLLKPDAIHLAKEIEEIILKAGFTILQRRTLRLSPEQCSEFYADRYGTVSFPGLTAFMSSGPIVALVLARHGAVAHWKAIIGPAKNARATHPACGFTTRHFVGHTKDVLSVAFSADNRQIVSGSRDKTVKLWNTLGVCKYTIQDESHSEWVSCVRFSPNSSNPIIVSCGWDKMVKVWNLANCKLKTNHIGHIGYLNTVTVSPDGSLCASGGKDGQAMLWDLNEGKHLYTLDSGDNINALCFSPNRYWLCAATGPSIKIWDLEGKIIVDELRQEVISTNSKAEPPQCTSLAWSADGQVTIGTR